MKHREIREEKTIANLPDATSFYPGYETALVVEAL